MDVAASCSNHEPGGTKIDQTLVIDIGFGIYSVASPAGLVLGIKKILFRLYSTGVGIVPGSCTGNFWLTNAEVRGHHVRKAERVDETSMHSLT